MGSDLSSLSPIPYANEEWSKLESQSSKPVWMVSEKWLASTSLTCRWASHPEFKQHPILVLYKETGITEMLVSLGTDTTHELNVVRVRLKAIDFPWTFHSPVFALHCTGEEITEMCSWYQENCADFQKDGNARRFVDYLARALVIPAVSGFEVSDIPLRLSNRLLFAMTLSCTDKMVSFAQCKASVGKVVKRQGSTLGKRRRSSDYHRPAKRQCSDTRGRTYDDPDEMEDGEPLSFKDDVSPPARSETMSLLSSSFVSTSRSSSTTSFASRLISPNSRNSRVPENRTGDSHNSDENCDQTKNSTNFSQHCSRRSQNTPERLSPQSCDRGNK